MYTAICTQVLRPAAARGLPLEIERSPLTQTYDGRTGLARPNNLAPGRAHDTTVGRSSSVERRAQQEAGP